MVHSVALTHARLLSRFEALSRRTIKIPSLCPQQASAAIMTQSCTPRHPERPAESVQTAQSSPSSPTPAHRCMMRRQRLRRKRSQSHLPSTWKKQAMEFRSLGIKIACLSELAGNLCISESASATIFAENAHLRESANHVPWLR